MPIDFFTPCFFGFYNSAIAKGYTIQQIPKDSPFHLRITEINTVRNPGKYDDWYIICIKAKGELQRALHDVHQWKQKRECYIWSNQDIPKDKEIRERCSFYTESEEVKEILRQTDFSKFSTNIPINYSMDFSILMLSENGTHCEQEALN